MTLRALAAALLALALGLAPLGAFAQAQRPPARPAPAAGSQSFSLDPSGSQGPLAIDSDRLEVRDRDKMAIFTGNVVARRGDSTLRATAMTVFYDGDSPGRPSTPPPAAGQPQQQQQIRRIEMSGPVFFCQRDQTARGERAVYERATERLVMTGSVVLTQGPNVVTGPRLVVNLRNNQAQVQSDPARPNERVRSLFQSGGQAQPAAPPPAC
jgi:lipopolysaccharide export system protein LptA